MANIYKLIINALIFILLSVLYLTPGVAAKSTELTFELTDNSKQCFHEDLAVGVKAQIEFQVVTGGYYDVDMTLYDPKQSVLYQGVKKQFDTHSWTTAMAAGEEDPLPNAEKGPTAMTKFEASAVNIHENLNSIMDAQTHYKLAEVKGRKRALDLNHRVMTWSAFETLAVLVVGFLQVYVLKSFFSNKKSIIPLT